MTSETHSRILFADDDASMRLLVGHALEREGYSVAVAVDGQDALDAIRTDPYDLIVLDVTMPRLNGIETCRRARAFTNVPIMMLTARGDEEDVVKGFSAGADDYLRKPFSVRELLARVQAGLRRVRLNAPPPEAWVYTGRLAVDLLRNEALLNGRPLPLTEREGSLLTHLARQIGHPLTPMALTDLVWGPGYTDDPAFIALAIFRLRRKLEPDPLRPSYLRTRRPAGGYYLAQIDVGGDESPDAVVEAAAQVEAPPHIPLSVRELEIVRLAATGLSSAEIGARLGVSGNTVSHYFRTVKGKLRLSSPNRVIIVDHVRTLGLID